MRKVDYIIVGQGLAGTFLSWFLGKEGKTYIVIDNFYPSSASRVAAGIIHPVTGRRIVKTWMADTLIPFAGKSYAEMESEFSAKIFHPLPTLELLSTAKECNDWLGRSEEPEMQPYIGNMDAGNLYDDVIHQFRGKVSVSGSAWINIGNLLSSFRNSLMTRGMLREEQLDFNQLHLTDEGVEYDDIQAEKIIFCDGVAALENPFWNHLPFLPSKGEVLFFRADIKLDHILNRSVHILPLGGDLFRAGSTFTWDFENDLPTAKGKDFLVSQLKEILRIPFEVVDHQAAIRPTVKNRRPFIGLHFRHRQIGIFNGLGTKGCLLAPYFAGQFAGFLSGKNPLMKETDAGNFVR